MASTFDGVVANFSGKFVELGNKRYGTAFTELDQQDWDFKPWFTKQQVDEVWDLDIKPTKNFWLTLRPLEGTNLLNQIGFADRPDKFFNGHQAEAIFITARVPTVGMTIRQQTCTWLRNHFLITFPNVIVVDQPAEKIPLCKNLGIDSFIDDKPSTIRELHKAGFKTYAKLSPYNCREPFPEGVVAVETLDEFLEEELGIGKTKHR